MTKSQALPADFCADLTQSCLQLITASCSFTLRAMPGLGVSFFLKHLMHSADYHWLPLNLYELPQAKPHTLVQHLANLLVCPIPGKHDSLVGCIEGRIRQLAEKHERIVLVFNRFDALDHPTNTFLLNTLRSIRDIDRERVVFIFASTNSLAMQLTTTQMDSFNLFSKEVFLKPFKPADLKHLLTLDRSASLVAGQDLPKVIELSGGHHSLAQTLLRCQSLSNPLGDPMVRLQLDYILSCLTLPEREQLTRKNQLETHTHDSPLVQLGFVRQETYFTSLLETHLTSKSASQLPPKEMQLLKLLQQHSPECVSKDTLIETLWPYEDDAGSEWALTALLYRLRKHPSFIASGNTIVTYKKRGYALIEQD